MSTARVAHAPVSMPVERAVAIPWYVWCSVAAVTSAMIGVQWDISWHRSIGRDTFLTPPHVAIYLSGVLAGLACGYMIFATTFGRARPMATASVTIWGLRGPLGAFVAAWGGVTMLTSAPFDDWWHNAYGLDTKILSPPHSVLALGIFCIQLGALLLVLGHVNRAAGEARRRLTWVFLYLGATSVILLQTFVMEYTSRSSMHTALFYLIEAIVLPLILTAVARAVDHPFGTTLVAAGYMIFNCLLIWVLPLFPAEPKLGPVYHSVTCFIPPQFPLLVIAPALAMDLLRAKLTERGVWLQALAQGVAFVAVLIAVQWPMAHFLMSPYAANRVFGTIYHGYQAHPSWADVRGVFYRAEGSSAEYAGRMAGAFVVAVLLARAGLAWGAWMRTLKR